MKVLLLAGHNPSSLIPKITALHEHNTCFLDWQIAQLEILQLEVVVVLSGEGSDEILRACQKIESTEIVFDTNGKEASLSSNLKAGLSVVNRECFILPAQVPVPPSWVWRKIHQHWFRQQSAYHVSCPHCPIEGEMKAGYPIMVTVDGLDLIKASDNWNSLADHRLIYSPVPIIDDCILAD